MSNCNNENTHHDRTYGAVGAAPAKRALIAEVPGEVIIAAALARQEAAAVVAARSTYRCD